jgi:Protein of unknown function (DUF3987)
VLNQIPNELRILSQWVCAGENKLPLNPRNGQPADVTDPRTWATFEEAKSTGYRHIGFVLSGDDPYSIIDLDEPTTPEQAERHRRIFQAFNSYAELSQSGKGIHIIVRGKVPSGVRRDKVELYSALRYMICTGNVINDLPITDHQPLLEQLHREMASTVIQDLEDKPEVIGDEAVYDMAARAANGDKFASLFNGQLNGYPSQSEADFALLSMFCFYSKNDEQVKRLFRYSQLGKRDKATRNDAYLDRALSKIRARQYAPPVDLSGLEIAPRLAEPPPVPPPVPSNLLVPPGLIGEMADYIYSSAIRPVREVALTAALAFGAGIVGRHFNISNTGLNQYIILLAKTGTGKEGAVGGIDALLSAIRAQVPVADEFVGPGTFASGQALTRVLDKTPCFVSILGEVGITLQQICDKNAGAHNVQLRKVLLDIYAKSGWNKWLRPSVYSDQEKNTAIVRAPNVTILGESTPENFYGALDSNHITEGLVPRFLVVEYHGLRPPANAQAFHMPSPSLIHRLVEVCQTVLAMRNNESCSPVQVDQWARGAMEAFNVQADDRINNAGEDEVIKQLWNRAHIKALKLAALVAVGCNLHQPIVTKDIAQWAIDLVTGDIDNMTAKFKMGEVGAGDHAQEADIVRAINKYSALTNEQRKQYKVPSKLLEDARLLPYVYLKRYLVQRASFKNDKRGAVTALKIALDDMVKAGTLSRLAPEQSKSMFETDSPVYYRGDTWD